MITLGSNTYINGNVGIGISPLPTANLYISKTLTGASFAWGFLIDSVIQSSVTNGAFYYRTDSSTAAASFTLANLNHFDARQATFGAGSTVTTQRGFWAGASLVGATNNYAFQGSIPSGTNRWNLFMDGTANNYLAGSLGIGGTSLTGINLRISKTLTGATIAYGALIDGQVQTDVTSQANYFQTSVNTVASTTISYIRHFYASQSTFGAGSTITEQAGFNAESNLIGGTFNYGFRGQIPAGTNRWNIYMDGTANNYLAGSLGIGNTSLTGITLNIAKNLTGATASTQVFAQPLIQSDVTGTAIIYNAFPSTQAAAFTINNLYYYQANQSTIGAASAINTQVGFRVASSLTGATNNFAFRSELAAASNVWNLYMQGTANNYLAGRLAIGSTSGIASRTVSNRFNLTGGITAIGYEYEGVVLSDVTSDARVYSSFTGTQAATFTLSRLTHYQAGQGTIGAGSTVTTQYGFWAQNNIIGATNNFGFVGDIPSGTNRWNLYMAGTANNYLAGNLFVGVTSGTAWVDVAAGTTAKAQINLATSVAPTTPNDGDIWFDGTAIKVRVAGVTRTIAVV